MDFARSCLAWALGSLLVACATGSAEGAGELDSPLPFGEDPSALLTAMAWPPIASHYRVQGAYLGFPNGAQAFADWRLEQADYDGCDRALAERRIDGCPSSGISRWRQLIAYARQEANPRSEFVLQWVNDVINQYRVVGPRPSPDTWLTPEQFFFESGVAVDSSLVKYATLRALGIPDRDLLIVVGRDRRRGQPWHAIVLVREPADTGTRVFALDSVEERVLNVNELAGYFEPWHVVMERGAFTVRHLIGSACSTDTRQEASAMGLICDTVVGRLGAYTLPCDSQCPGDPRTVCADVESPSVPGAPGLCVHTPMSGCAGDHEYRVVRRRFDGERAVACVPLAWRR